MNQIHSTLDQWRSFKAPKVVIFAPGKGHRAFSAGGDIKDFYHMMKGENPDFQFVDGLNLDEYSLHLRLAVEDFF